MRQNTRHKIGSLPSTVHVNKKRDIKNIRDAFYIVTSRNCNNNCAFCMKRNYMKRNLPADSRHYLSAGKLKEQLSGVPLDTPIFFTGGEPTINPQLSLLVRTVRQLGYRNISLQTNGRRLYYENYCLGLVKLGISQFIISIHGGEEKVHDAMTRISGSFRQTTKGLQNLLHLKSVLPFFKVITVSPITSINFKDMPRLIEFLMNQDGIDEIVLNPLTTDDKSLRDLRQSLVSYSRVFSLFKMIKDSLKSDGVAGFDKIRFINIPHCIIRGAESSQCLSVSLHPPFLDTGFHKLSPKKGSRKIKRPKCNSCSHYSECTGVALNYIKAFGWSEFIPEARVKKIFAHVPDLGDRRPLVIDPIRWNRDQWRNFFCDEDVRREIDSSMYLIETDRIFRIEHAEMECQFSRFEDDGQTISFFNYPWLALPFRGPLYRVFLPACEITDIRDIDVILGTQKKLESLINSIIAESENSKIVSLTSLCTSTVIGDDMDAVLRRCEGKVKCPLVYVNTRLKKDLVVFDEIFKIIRNSSAFFKIASKANTVNLVDFSMRYRREELQPLLKELGIDVNVCVLPEIEVGKLQQYMAASMQVLFRGSPREVTIQKHLVKLPIETLIVPAPYGLEGARECAKTIARAFRKEKEFDRIWKKIELPVISKWKEFRLQASQYSLALVVDEQALSLLDEPRYLFGVPLLKLLGEMGFRIEFLAYAPSSDSVSQRIVDFTAKWRLDSRITIHTFSNHQELQELLRGGKFRAVYSDIYHDWRLTEAGKSQFSLRYFEMGLHGALYSLDNLLGLCRLPFYERYGRYLVNAPRSRDV